jgi:sialic acid synthase
MKYRAIIQARMLSKRLRGKSLMAVAGRPLLNRVIDCVRGMEFIDQIVVATSDEAADDPIAAQCSALSVGCFRGASEDVLGRFTAASADLSPDATVVRFTADNPLYEPRISRMAYSRHSGSTADYTCIQSLSHVVPEFIRVGALRRCHELAASPFDREHVTPFIRLKAEHFSMQVLPPDFGGLRPDYDRFLTIDTPEQLHVFDQMLEDVSSKTNTPNLADYYLWIDRYVRGLSPSPVEPATTLRINLAGHQVGDGCPCFIIAEIGQNHNGQLGMAKRLIDMAARCGADAVKFQKRDIGWELTEEAYNRPYEGPNSFGATYGLHREFLELNADQHAELKEYAQSQKLIYFCTPCDPPSVDVLEKIGNPIYKVASRDITNIPLLKYIARTGKPVIISTGMAGLPEIREALEAFAGSKCEVALMQCVSQYPAEAKNINLNAMKTMRDEFGVLVALSDHTPGVITGVAGSVLGAFAVEKHITLARAMPGTDHAAALEEEGLRRLIGYIRTCEEARGDGRKEFNPVAESARQKLARSLVSAVDIPEGTVLTEEMLTLKSPGTGLSWNQRDQIVGHQAIRSVPAHTTLAVSDFA